MFYKGCIRHQRRTFGNITQAFVNFLQVIRLFGADDIVHFGCFRDNICGLTTIRDDVLDASAIQHMFAHIVRADVHQFNCI